MSQLKTGRSSKKDKATVSTQKNEESIIRMNVNVPKTFYKKIKQRALDEDISITELVKRALSEYINK